jgi:hypothetical protein
MSAKYLSITPMLPYDLGVDDQGRAKCQFNLSAEKTASTGGKSVEEELVKILETAGVVVSTGAGRNVFVGTNAQIPSGGGPYVSIIITSGLSGLKTHNDQGTAYERPTALIVVRATDYAVARAKARAAYDVLDKVRNQVVTP